jgi:hypothetical protein
MSLLDYVRVYDRFFEKRDCLKLVRNLKDWKPHVYMRSDGIPIEHGNLSVSWHHPEEAKIFQMGVWYALDQYIKDISCPEFSGWNDYSPIRFNRYDPGGDMDTHIDHIHSLFDGEKKGIPVLSIVGVLNNDFQGGEFELCGEVMDMPAGSVIIFPSVFMYPHRVRKVLRGTRFSWVSWAW